MLKNAPKSKAKDLIFFVENIFEKNYVYLCNNASVLDAVTATKQKISTHFFVCVYFHF